MKQRKIVLDFYLCFFFFIKTNLKVLPFSVGRRSTNEFHRFHVGNNLTFKLLVFSRAACLCAKTVSAVHEPVTYTSFLTNADSVVQ